MTCPNKKNKKNHTKIDMTKIKKYKNTTKNRKINVKKLKNIKIEK